MPRQDVPYGGAICRLKERIAEIWDELGKKLHSINGVEGDAAGDVKIVSGDAAVVVTSDQVNHEIEIALDSSQLPAAAVSSVNGQTGAVVLDANDIDAGLVPPGTSVAQDLASTKQQLQVVGGLVQQEILDRQNADSMLQTNINTLSASLPSAAAAAVAADPTVAQLVADLAGKVDLSDVSTVETPDTIAKRNGSGRLVAADPVSGATDKTLVTANWVSQTGAGRPNNLIHDGGNEIINGGKTFVNRCTINASGIYPIPIVFKMTSEDATDLSTLNGMGVQVNDNNDAALFRILLFKNRKAKSLVIRFYDSAGVGHDVTVASYTEP